jgi:DNA-binding NarL/FixJ family response regulator
VGTAPAILRGMRVFLVEDSALVCERLIELIESAGEHQVIGQADTYDKALAGIASAIPDVGIFDVSLARGNGIDALAEAKRRRPDLIGIILSNHVTPQHAKAGAEAGAAFFLDKSTEFERITEILSKLAVDAGKKDVQ